MATISIDVLQSCILARLPVKSLLRFKSVSKTWQTVISSREFINLYHQYTISSDADSLFVLVDKDLQQMFHVYELDSPLSPVVHWYNPKPAKPESTKNMSILDSCEFFLLVNIKGIHELVLLNPSTGKNYKIPHPPFDCGYKQRYGMYLDEANNDYKVARITQKYPLKNSAVVETNTEITVYSLRTNTWRLIDRRFDIRYSIWCNGTAAVIRNLLHMIFVPFSFNSEHELVYGKKIIIACFDILAEKWTNDVPFPPVNNLRSINLSVLDGLLCVTGVDTEENGSEYWNVWVMKKYGDKDSWFKLMNIASNDSLYKKFYPIAFRNRSRDEVLCSGLSNGEYIWYDIRKKKVVSAAMKGFYGYICKGSLVDFPGVQHHLD
ncbi:F-box protein CPR1-like [Silene latifolia]|uniref:F-box protein CPR1-like n=1 Tax=Silene latifolia TaxID=37657 RepID=UPI003D77B41F